MLEVLRVSSSEGCCSPKHKLMTKSKGSSPASKADCNSAREAVSWEMQSLRSLRRAAWMFLLLGMKQDGRFVRVRETDNTLRHA